MNHHSLLLVLIFVANLLFAQNSPVTTITSIYNCTPGTVTVPIKVNNFNAIGAFSLDLQYDPSVLNFIQGIRNPALLGSFMAGDNLLPGGQHHIVISWFGPPCSLPDGSNVVELKFTFLGGTAALTWIDDGSSCEYADGSYNPLADMPTGCFYHDGEITEDRKVELSLLLQGLYNPLGPDVMVSAIGDQPEACSQGIADYISVELHSAVDFSITEYTTPMIELSASGQTDFLVPPNFNGSYFLTVRHRNSIAVVSANPVLFSSAITSYSFINGQAQAYGDNMTMLPNGMWALFSGDVNQDDIIDSGDMIMVDNDVSGFVTGYVPSDCNGDGLVDSSDMIMVDNNAASFVTAAYP